jgi:hypothetical protein
VPDHPSRLLCCVQRQHHRWSHTDINVKAALLLVQAAGPHLKRGSRVVFISSVTAFE